MPNSPEFREPEGPHQFRRGDFVVQTAGEADEINRTLTEVAEDDGDYVSRAYKPDQWVRAHIQKGHHRVWHRGQLTPAMQEAMGNRELVMVGDLIEADTEIQAALEASEAVRIEVVANQVWPHLVEVVDTELGTPEALAEFMERGSVYLNLPDEAFEGVRLTGQTLDTNLVGVAWPHYEHFDHLKRFDRQRDMWFENKVSPVLMERLAAYLLSKWEIQAANGYQRSALSEHYAMEGDTVIVHEDTIPHGTTYQVDDSAFGDDLRAARRHVPFQRFVGYYRIREAARLLAPPHTALRPSSKKPNHLILFLNIRPEERGIRVIGNPERNRFSHLLIRPREEDDGAQGGREQEDDAPQTGGERSDLEQVGGGESDGQVSAGVAA